MYLLVLVFFFLFTTVIMPEDGHVGSVAHELRTLAKFWGPMNVKSFGFRLSILAMVLMVFTYAGHSWTEEPVLSIYHFAVTSRDMVPGSHVYMFSDYK
jgi:hypothetical protein